MRGAWYGGGREETGKPYLRVQTFDADVVLFRLEKNHFIIQLLLPQAKMSVCLIKHQGMKMYGGVVV
jgi:hypothetical protein